MGPFPAAGPHGACAIIGGVARNNDTKRRERSGARPAGWVLVLSGLAAVLAAMTRVGAVIPGDMPMIPLAVASGVGLWWIAARRLSASDSPEHRGWRPALALVGVAAALGIAAMVSSQRFTAVLGAPGSSLGLVQIAMLAVVVLACAYIGKPAARALRTAAPWMLLLEALSTTMQLSRGGVGAGGTTSNSTFLSQVVVLLLPLVIVPAEDGSVTGWRRIAHWTVAAWATATLAFGASRAGFGLAVLAIAASVVAARVRRRARLGAHARVAVLVGGAALFALPVAAAAVLPSGPGIEAQLLSRPYMWEAATGMWLGSPLVGVGPDAFRVASAPIMSARVSVVEAAAESTFGTLPADPHNALMLVLAGGGVLALAAVGWFGWEVLRNWSAQEAVGRLDRASALGILMYASTAVLAPVPLQTAVLAAVVTGASLLPERPPVGDRGLPPIVRRWGVRSALGVASLLWLALTAHTLTRVAVGPIETGTVAAAQAERTSTAAALWRVDPFLHFWAGRMWAFVGVERGDPAAGERAFAETRRALELEPANPYYARERALGMSLLGDDATETARWYDEALRLFPNWYECRAEYARYLLDTGRAAAAEPHAAAALELGPRFPESYELAASVAEALGRVGEAEALRRRAIAVAADASARP